MTYEPEAVIARLTPHRTCPKRAVLLMIPEEIITQLDQAAEEEDCSRAAVIRAACRQLLARRGTQAGTTQT